MFSCGTFRRAARSLTCRTDSSPVIYKTVCWLEMAPHSCSSMVDLPTPGSPLSNTTPPSTMPPPSTRSSSEMPVRMRLFSSVVLISASRLAVREVTPSCRAAAAVLPPERPALGASATTSSFMVFQLPQLGQRPIQRGLVSPQLEQTYTVLSFGSFILWAPVRYTKSFVLIIPHRSKTRKKDAKEAQPVSPQMIGQIRKADCPAAEG